MAAGVQPGGTIEEDNVGMTCIVPIGWRRELQNGVVTYFSSSGFKLTSIPEIKAYLATEGTCKCGLQCPLIVDKVFNFDCKVTAKVRLAEDVIRDSDLTKLCNHKRKVIAMASLLADLDNEHDSSKIDCKASPKGTKRSRTKAKVSPCQPSPSLSVSKLFAMQQGDNMSGPLPSMDSFTASRHYNTPNLMTTQFHEMNNPGIQNFPIQTPNQLAGDIAFDALLAARTMEKLNGYNTGDSPLSMQGIPQHIPTPGVHHELVVGPNGGIFPGVVPLPSNMLPPNISPGSCFPNIHYKTNPQFLHGKQVHQMPGHVPSFIQAGESHVRHRTIHENHPNHLRRGMTFTQAEGQFYPPQVPIQNLSADTNTKKLALPVLEQSMITSFPASTLLTAAARAQIAEQVTTIPTDKILSNQIRTVPNQPNSVPLLKDGHKTKMQICKEDVSDCCDLTRPTSNDCLTNVAKNLQSGEDSTNSKEHLVLKRTQNTDSVQVNTSSESSPKKPKLDESGVSNESNLNSNTSPVTLNHEIKITSTVHDVSNTTTVTVGGASKTNMANETKTVQYDHMIHQVQVQRDQEMYLSMMKNQSSMVNPVPAGFNPVVGGMYNNFSNFPPGTIPPQHQMPSNIVLHRNASLPSLSEKSTKEWLAEMNMKNMQQSFVNFQHQQRMGFGPHMLPGGNHSIGPHMHPSMLQNMLQQGSGPSQIGPPGVGFQHIPNPMLSVDLQTTPIGSNMSRPNRRKSPGRQSSSIKKSVKGVNRTGPQKVKDILAMRKEKEKEIERERKLLKEAEKSVTTATETIYKAVIDASGTNMKIIIASEQEKTESTSSLPVEVSTISNNNDNLVPSENLKSDNCKIESFDVQPSSLTDQSEDLAITIPTSSIETGAVSELSSLPSNEVPSSHLLDEDVVIAGDDNFKSTIVENKAQVLVEEEKNQRTVCESTITLPLSSEPLSSEPLCSHSIADEKIIIPPNNKETATEIRNEQTVDCNAINDSIDCDIDKGDRLSEVTLLPKDNVSDAIVSDDGNNSHLGLYKSDEDDQERIPSGTSSCEFSMPASVLTESTSTNSTACFSSDSIESNTTTEIQLISNTGNSPKIESTVHNKCDMESDMTTPICPNESERITSSNPTLPCTTLSRSNLVNMDEKTSTETTSEHPSSGISNIENGNSDVEKTIKETEIIPPSTVCIETPDDGRILEEATKTENLNDLPQTVHIHKISQESVELMHRENADMVVNVEETSSHQVIESSISDKSINPCDLPNCDDKIIGASNLETQSVIYSKPTSEEQSNDNQNCKDDKTVNDKATCGLTNQLPSTEKKDDKPEAMEVEDSPIAVIRQNVDTNLDDIVQLNRNLVQDNVESQHKGELKVEKNTSNVESSNLEIITECNNEMNNTKEKPNIVESAKCLQSPQSELETITGQSLQKERKADVQSIQKIKQEKTLHVDLPNSMFETDVKVNETTSLIDTGNVTEQVVLEVNMDEKQDETSTPNPAVTNDECCHDNVDQNSEISNVEVNKDISATDIVVHKIGEKEISKKESVEIVLDEEKDTRISVTTELDGNKCNLNINPTDKNRNVKSAGLETISKVEHIKAVFLSERLENSDKEFTLLNLVNGEHDGRLLTRKEKQKDVIKSAIDGEYHDIDQHNVEKPEDNEEACKENTNCTHDSSPPSPEEELPPSFGIGDLVWGQIRGCASWPGKVVSESDVKGHRNSESGKIWVKWFGDHTFTQVEPDKLKNLTEGLEAHHTTRARSRRSRKITSSLEIAIQEAMTELDKKMEQVRAPLQY
ncbi:uncharacterized protein [Antedon mediterranea]|uniref:uncharacterized protein isoform X2 n=1 Tax=Antedon mediterranea TaxID=105859 RepID=UPI003AF47F5C